jgi:branched-chain amino acid transport system ATP-binding protein
MTTLLEVIGLSSGYGRTPVIRNVSLTVGSSEVVVLLGANGAGKSTTLRAISNLLPSTVGDVNFLGTPSRKTPPHRLTNGGLVHIPEGRGIFYSLTVAEHFGLGGRTHRAARFDEARKLFPELAKLEKRLAGQLSGGEQQMLALGVALAKAPQLLMIDELSLGLAPVVVERLMPVVREYASTSGAGVLLVEQHTKLALHIADRGYLMNHGALGSSLSAAELLADDQLILDSYLGTSRG